MEPTTLSQPPESSRPATSQDRPRPPATESPPEDRSPTGAVPWHTLPASDVLARLGVTGDGLTAAESAARLAEHGPNALPASGPTPLWRIVLRQFASPLIYVLLAAAAVSLLIGEHVDAFFIGLVLLINAGIGAWQESGAERSAAALQGMLQVRARVRRDGHRVELPAEELVPGDVVALASGERVPADLRLLSSSGLRVDESALTGESQAAEKDATALAATDAPLGDRAGMLFAGTTVASGRAEGVVVATGGDSELGTISRAAGSQRGGTAPLVVRMERFSRHIALATLLGASLYAAIALAQGEAVVQVFFLAVALVVSAIPEGLPVALTSTLAIGANRMAREGVIVRGTSAVEGLGSTTVIASDKTGTLTVNRQTVRLVALPGGGGRDGAPSRAGAAGQPPGDDWRHVAVSGAGDRGEGELTWPVDGLDGPDAPEPAAIPDDLAARVRSLAAAGSLADEATLVHEDGTWRSEGDAVDVAVLALAHKVGVDPEELRRRTTELAAIPYESERAYSAVRVALADPTGDPAGDPASDPACGPVAALGADLVPGSGDGSWAAGGTVVAVKGALGAVLPFVGALPGPGATAGAVPLDPGAAARVQRQADELAARGYRVIAVAAGPGGPAVPGEGGGEGEDGGEGLDEADLSGLTLLGLVGMIDPLRPEARDAIATARGAGVRVAMVTGDHPATAAAIGRELGLLDQPHCSGSGPGPGTGPGPGPEQDASPDVVTGVELAALVPPEDDPDGSRAAADPGFVAAVRTGRVFARVAPIQKLQIVRALQADGEFTAVTGDGVNDAPALRAANIGVAMGSGTDAAKDVADLIVTDDDFASIVTGVEQGRHAYANVRKVVWLLVATGLAEITLFLLALLAGLPAPLVAVQLLWLNIVTNGIQAVALAFEGGEPGVMRRGPRHPDESLLDRRMIHQVVVAGAVMAAGALAVWWWALTVAGMSEDAARNLVLLVMVLFENVHALNSRSETTSAFRVPWRRNPMLVLGILAAFGVHLLALQLPPLQAVLGTAPVSLEQFAVLAVIAVTLLLAVELLKASRRRRAARTADVGTASAVTTG